MGNAEPNVLGAVLVALAVVVPTWVAAAFVAFLGGMEGFAAADGGRVSSAGAYYLVAALVAAVGAAVGIAVVRRSLRKRNAV